MKGFYVRLFDAFEIIPACVVDTDVLYAKQEALDRGVPFPFSKEELCSRCQALFATLDLAHDACVDIRRDELPEKLSQAMLDEFSAVR